MSETVDARGKGCPHPVLMTIDALSQIDTGTLNVIVDSDVSRENVLRCARDADCSATVVKEEENEFTIEIVK